MPYGSWINDLPTSFALSPEAVDRLRMAGATLVRESPEFARLLRELTTTPVR